MSRAQSFAKQAEAQGAKISVEQRITQKEMKQHRFMALNLSHPSEAQHLGLEAESFQTT